MARVAVGEGAVYLALRRGVGERRGISGEALNVYGR